MRHCLLTCRRISRSGETHQSTATTITIYCRLGSKLVSFGVLTCIILSLSKIGITDGFASLLWLLISLYELENNKMHETNTKTYDIITKIGSMLRHFNFAVCYIQYVIISYPYLTFR